MEDGRRLTLGGNPDWMSSLPVELLDVPLWSLAIPGKQNLGSLGLLVLYLLYFINNSLPYVSREP